MIVKQAKEIARRWVVDEASNTPGFRGAFFHGSTTWLADDAILAATSDVDVIVVLADPNPQHKPGKLLYRDVLLDVSYLPSDELRSPELVLSQSHLAGSFRTPSVIADPTGQLTELQAAVAKNFAKRQWVIRRCEHARDKVLQNLATLTESEAFHDQVTAWLFATGVTTHIVLTSGLKNPTVRNRYVAVRQLLSDYQHSEFYETLLEMLGCAQLSRSGVESHLDALTDVFDATKAIIKTPFFFASDISDIGRVIAIDGSRELIERGDHREAMFWIVATYSRCRKVLASDAPVELQDRFSPGYRRLLADLGIISEADLQRRGKEVRASLPQVWEVAEAIMAANPEIED